MIVTHPTFADAPVLAARLGLKLFPVRLIPGPNGTLNKVPAVKGGHGYLDATDDPAVLAEWARQYPDAAIGVPCRPNGIIVLDDDSHIKGRGILAEWQVRLGGLSPTLPHTSIRGGKHLLFTDPGGKLIGRLGDDPGDDCEVKCNGYVVLTSLPDDWRTRLAPLPTPWIDAIRKPERAAARPNPAFHATASEWITTHADALGITGDAAGADHTKLFFPCPWQDEHTTGNGERDAALFVDDAGTIGFFCFHSHCQGRTIAEVAAALDLPDPFPEVVIDGIEEQERSAPLTEQRFAELLVARGGRDLRWVLERRRWYAWTSKCWEDSSLEEERRAQALATEVYAEACKTQDKKTILAALKAQTEPFQRHALLLARSACTASLADFDTHPLWLNVENGTLDLTDPTTPVLRPHDRTDLLTRLTPVVYDPSASSLEWDAFLTDVLPDPDLRAYLQRLMGMSLVAEPVQVILLIHGPGGTGKTTFIEAINGTLGEFAEKTAFDTFLKKHGGGGVPNDIAKLAGSRLVFADESDEGREFSAALVKNLTGGNTISARFLYGEFFSFAQQFLLCFVCNDLPVFSNLDTGMLRRVVCIPFMQVIPPARKDESLIQRLSDPRQTGSAILNWLLTGLVAYRQAELRNPPAGALAAKQDYLDDLDPIKDFWDAVVVCSPWARVDFGTLYRRYKNYMEEEGQKFVLGKKRFARQVRHRGLQDTKSNGMQYWLGIDVR